MITVKGQKQYFAQVEDFVHRAPTIVGWTIEALKAPVESDAGTEIQTGKVKFKLGDLKYTHILASESQNSVIVYFPFDVAKDQDGFDGLAWNLVSDALGEKLTATLKPTVSAKQLPTDINKDLKPMVAIHADAAQWLGK